MEATKEDFKHIEDTVRELHELCHKKNIDFICLSELGEGNAMTTAVGNNRGHTILLAHMIKNIEVKRPGFRYMILAKLEELKVEAEKDKT